MILNSLTTLSVPGGRYARLCLDNGGVFEVRLNEGETAEQGFRRHIRETRADALKRAQRLDEIEHDLNIIVRLQAQREAEMRVA